jgi:hypothetical protein
MLQPSTDGVAGTTSSYGLVAMLLTLLLVSAIVAGLVTLAVTAIRRSARAHRASWAGPRAPHS